MNVIMDLFVLVLRRSLEYDVLACISVVVLAHFSNLQIVVNLAAEL